MGVCIVGDSFGKPLVRRWIVQSLSRLDGGIIWTHRIIQLNMFFWAVYPWYSQVCLQFTDFCPGSAVSSSSGVHAFFLSPRDGFCWKMLKGSPRYDDRDEIPWFYPWFIILKNPSFFLHHVISISWIILVEQRHKPPIWIHGVIGDGGSCCLKKPSFVARPVCSRATWPTAPAVAPRHRRRSGNRVRERQGDSMGFTEKIHVFFSC